MRCLAFIVLLTCFLSACAKNQMDREEWCAIQSDCREYARLSVAGAFGAGSIGNEEEIYNLCVKDALDRPRSLGDVRRKLKEHSSN